MRRKSCSPVLLRSCEQEQGCNSRGSGSIPPLAKGSRAENCHGRDGRDWADVTSSRLCPWSRRRVDSPRVGEFDALFGTTAGDDTPRELLADALYLAIWQTPPDYQRAVLTAAVACEVHAKRTLQRKCSPESVELVKWLFSDQRSFPYSAHDLFGPIAKALVGRSLASDDKITNKAVQNLFEMRKQSSSRSARARREESPYERSGCSVCVRMVGRSPEFVVIVGRRSAETLRSQPT
jgi:hypothetical protein